MNGQQRSCRDHKGSLYLSVITQGTANGLHREHVGVLQGLRLLGASFSVPTGSGFKPKV